MATHDNIRPGAALPLADGAGQVATAARGPAALSDATRFLSAAAYLDEGFSRTVVQELFGKTVRAVAPSYGFDLRLVALHCLAARRARRIRDALLAAVAVLMWLGGGAITTV